MSDQDKLLLQQKAIQALRERIEADNYLTIDDVCTRLDYSRGVVETMPQEVLPFIPYGRGSRIYRRYHPADVAAVDARLRAWERAKQAGRGDEHLARLRAELDAQDEASIALAVNARKAVA